MKKQTSFALLALILVIFCLANGCQKQPAHYAGQNAGADSNQVLIAQARQYMTQQHNTDSISQPGDTLLMDRTSLHKTPLWSQAQVQTFSFGKGIVVPIRVAEPLSIRVGADQQSVSISLITWLLLYRDASLNWHAEVVTRLPNAIDPSAPFQGKVRIEDWQGHFLKAFLYQGDTSIRLTLSTTFKRQPIAPFSSKAPTLEAAIKMDCTETDWYACSSVGDVDMGCEYEYSTEECSVSGGGSDAGGADPGSPSAGDYASVGGGSGGSASSPSATTITPDTSVTANPIVACVWNHLMSTQLTNGLKSVLSAFDDNTIYNITFVVSAGEDTADGVCSYKGNNNFLVTLNGSEADDPDYSRIWLASTFIHEAFHAKLRQKALATFGETAISQWPTPIDDMTLSQLANYFEAESKSENIWASVEHDWMVDNISEMATSLQDFVQTFYKSTYDSAGSTLAPYIALMYMGLQNSTLYQEQIVDQGQQTTIENYWRDLAEGGKCSD